MSQFFGIELTGDDREEFRAAPLFNCRGQEPCERGNCLWCRGETRAREFVEARREQEEP